MKKVALLTHGIGTGGAERVISRLSKILLDKCELYLILFDASIQEYEIHCPVIDMKMPAEAGVLSKFSLAFKRTAALRKIKKQYNFDVVISFLDSPNIVNLLSKDKKNKTAVSIRNYSDLENSNSLVGKILRMGTKLLYKRADAVIPVTKVIAQSYHKNYGVKEKKLKVIYNPYDITSIEKSAKEELNEEHQEFFSNGFIISSVGRFAYQKGYWHLIKAFYLARKENQELKLCIIGDGKGREKTQKLIKDLGIEDHVLLCGRQENPFKFVAKSDLYVLSSLFEGFPNVLAEAMTVGCPVIATDCKSGPREILYRNPDLNYVCEKMETADFGILVPPLEKEENWDKDFFTEGEKILSEAIIAAAKNTEKSCELSKVAKERAADFSYSKCAEGYMQIIDMQ